MLELAVYYCTVNANDDPRAVLEANLSSERKL